MRLVIVSPYAVVVDEDVVHVRAEDTSGAFGILDRHADLLTALTVSVLTYRRKDGKECFVAVRGGLLTVSGRDRVEVLTREAMWGEELGQLKGEVVARFRRTAAEEERAQRDAKKLEGALLRRVSDFVHDQRRRRERRLVP